MDANVSHAWSINEAHHMWLIFDAVNPVRKFKRDSVYRDTDEEPFAEHDDSDLSETDAVPSRQPAYPEPYRCVDPA